MVPMSTQVSFKYRSERGKSHCQSGEWCDMREIICHCQLSGQKRAMSQGVQAAFRSQKRQSGFLPRGFQCGERQLIFILLLHAWKKIPCSLFLVSHTQGPEELRLPSLFPLRVLGALGVQAYTQGTLSPQGRRPRWDFFSGSSHLQTQKSVRGGR